MRIMRDAALALLVLWALPAPVEGAELGLK